MKHKKYSTLSLLLALVLVTSIICTAFATTAPPIADGTSTVTFSTVDDDNAIEAADSAAWVSDDSSVEYMSVPAGGQDADSIEVPAVELSSLPTGEASPLGTGSLAPGGKYFIDAQPMAANQRITVNVNYTPITASLRIGVRNNATNRIYDRLVTGGSGSATITIPTTGTYSIYVYNPSPTVPVHFSVSYFLQG